MHCRLDEIIVFRQLTKGEVKQIADIMLGEVFKRAEEKEIKIDVTERFKVHPAQDDVFFLLYAYAAHGCTAHALYFSCSFVHGASWTCIHSKPALPEFIHFFQDRLVDEGYNPAYGARPLRRAIMRLLEDSMAERMLTGDIKAGDSVIIDVDADGQINVLNGDKKMTSSVSAQPAGIS